MDNGVLSTYVLQESLSEYNLNIEGYGYIDNIEK